MNNRLFVMLSSLAICWLTALDVTHNSSAAAFILISLAADSKHISACKGGIFIGYTTS